MKVFGISDRGVVRSENQDRFQYKLQEDEDLAILVLCDGMGGARAGTLAAATGAAAFMTHASLCLHEKEPPDADVIVRESASYANIRVYDRAQKDEDCAGMGCTLVAALLQGEECALVNIGDSRAYLYSSGVLRQLTRDHSLVEDLVERHAITREEARVHPRRNVITRAVGLDYRVKSDTFHTQLCPGDKLLLCSDGLSNVVDAEVMRSILERYAEPEEACRALLELALAGGAPDNVTVLLLCR
ncbi:MAG: Stp1/IreP family PP2C-type Ser/Thr phosphatase [Oscillospiraceae bacterium]|nr:Stp1/IreP family PP2C-type Ser/Thr phosphatase [Oscillospiraceae bacterium]